MKNLQHIILAWELYQKQVKLTDIAKHCQKHRATVSLWIMRIKQIGLDEYLIEYRNAKKGQRLSRQVPKQLEQSIKQARLDDPGLSGYRIHRLLVESGASISISKVYEILRSSKSEI